MSMLVAEFPKPEAVAKVRMDLVRFTPVVAEEWLSRSRPNRPLVMNSVNAYARIMADGGWRINGEPLIVNSRGELLNGQHRLRAVIQADVEVTMLVVWGIEDDAFDTIDTGRARVGRDLIGIAGYKDSAMLATAAGWLWRYERSGGVLTQAQGRDKPTNHDLLETLRRHPRLAESIPFGNRVSGMLGRGAATFCHYILAQHDKAAADKFFGDLAEGADLRKGQAVLVLRNMLQDNKTAKRKMTQLYQIAITIRAFNYERVGRETRIVRWRQVGPARESFPVVAAVDPQDGATTG